MDGPSGVVSLTARTAVSKTSAFLSASSSEEYRVPDSTTQLRSGNFTRQRQQNSEDKSANVPLFAIIDCIVRLSPSILRLSPSLQKTVHGSEPRVFLRE